MGSCCLTCRRSSPKARTGEGKPLVVIKGIRTHYYICAVFVLQQSPQACQSFFITDGDSIPIIWLTQTGENKKLWSAILKRRLSQRWLNYYYQPSESQSHKYDWMGIGPLKVFPAGHHVNASRKRKSEERVSNSTSWKRHYHECLWMTFYPKEKHIGSWGEHWRIRQSEFPYRMCILSRTMMKAKQALHSLSKVDQI